MGVEVLFLIAGLAGGLLGGILIGRYYVPDDRLLKRKARHGSSYVRALNGVLAGDRDDALDTLKEVVSENIEDIEPYFAMAGLFRTTGEWDRAIRVHQAIGLREGQDKKTRLRVDYELGLDYRSAGMPRRATRALEQVLEQEPRHGEALQALCGLYEEQGQYDAAAEAWRRLVKLRGDDPPDRFYHLLCAAAQHAIAAGELDRARSLIREARKGAGPTVHVLAVSAELAAARGELDDAVAALEQALDVDPELAGVLVPGLVAAQRDLARRAWNREHRKGGAATPPPAHLEDLLDERAAEGAAARVDGLIERAGRNGHLELALAELRSHYDPAAALDDYRDIAEVYPDLLPARLAAARLALASGDEGDIQRELHALAASGGVLDWATEGSFRCARCGQRSEDFFWRCAHCRHWGSACLELGRAAHDVPLSEPAITASSSRRHLPRGGVHVALLGASQRALPAPPPVTAAASGSEHGERSSLLGRVGGFFSDAWSGLRGDRSASPDETTPDATTPGAPADSPGADAPPALAAAGASVVARAALSAGAPDDGASGEISGDRDDARDADRDDDPHDAARNPGSTAETP